MHINELQNQADSYFFEERWSSARDIYKQLLVSYLELYNQYDDDLYKQDVFFAYIKIGKTYFEEENHKKCALYYLKARKHYLKNGLNLKYGLERVHNRLYACFSYLEKHDAATYFQEFKTLPGKDILLGEDLTSVVNKFTHLPMWIENDNNSFPFVVDSDGGCFGEKKNLYINRLVEALVTKFEVSESEGYPRYLVRYLYEKAIRLQGKKLYGSSEALRGVALRFMNRSAALNDIIRVKVLPSEDAVKANRLGWGNLRFIKYLLSSVEKYDREDILKHSGEFWQYISCILICFRKNRCKRTCCFVRKLVQSNLDYILNVLDSGTELFAMHGCMFYHSHLEIIHGNRPREKFLIYYANKFCYLYCYWEEPLQKYKNYWRMAKSWINHGYESEYEEIMSQIAATDVFSFSLREKRSIRNYIFDMLKGTKNETLAEDIKSILIPLREDIKMYLDDIKKPDENIGDKEKVDQFIFCQDCRSFFVEKGDSISRVRCPECNGSNIIYIDSRYIEKANALNQKMTDFFGQEFEESDIKEIGIVYDRQSDFED
jgi:hypothetical protein